MANRKINPKEFIRDMKTGMDNMALLKKYQISSKTLQHLFKQLIDTGMITRNDLKDRIFRCTACGWSNLIIEKFEKCPQCETISSKIEPSTTTEHTQQSNVPSSDQTNLQSIPQAQKSAQEYKNCPYCGEQILKIAQKCKHCGEFLENLPQSIQPNEETTSPVKEKIIWEGHPSILYYLPLLILGAIFLLANGIGLIFIIYAAIDQQRKRFTITNKKIKLEVGLIARNIQEVAIKDIRSISFKQDIAARLLDFGTVNVASAATGAVEITFKGVRHPQKLKEIINELKDNPNYSPLPSD